MRDVTTASGLPVLTPTNTAWFTSGEVAIQRCLSCTTLQHPPEEVCHQCGAMEFDTKVLAPRGTVHSYTIVHHAANKALLDMVPYAVVLVSLDDAPHLRVVGNLEGEVHIGLAVVARWEDHDGDDGTTIRLLQWHHK